MRKLLTAVIGAMVGATVAAGTGYGAGPIYTIPATYEKVEKLAQGIAGRDLNTIDVNRALNTGANVRAFIQGATGKDVGSTYSPTYFTAYGNNYRQFVKNAVGVDVGGTTSSTSFANAGNNYRSLAQGMTGLTISGSYAYYYSNAGRNTRNFLYNVTGSNPNYYSSNFTYAGKNLRYGFYYLTDSSITSSRGYSAVYSKVRQKIDQLTYDMYVNPDGLKKVFSNLDSRVSNITQNLKPVSKDNKLESLGEGTESGKVVGNLVDNNFFLYFSFATKGYEITNRSGYYNGYYLYDVPKIVDNKGNLVAYITGYRCRIPNFSLVFYDYGIYEGLCLNTEEYYFSNSGLIIKK